jgi:putative peptidoglycan lipid II flippase
LLTVSSGTLASRLLGFLRDAMIAALLGAGAAADAFLLAFQLINVIRRLLSEGALNAALVPVWLRLRESDAPAAARFAGRLLGTVSAVLVALALLLGIAMPLIIGALAPGLAEQATLKLAVDDARLMLPYLAFAGPATVLLALASAQGRYALTAFAPLLLNIALIAVMIALLVVRREASFVGLALAATVGIAGLLQLLVLVLGNGPRLAAPFRISFDGDMRGFLARAFPGMIASASPQLLALAGAVIASALPSAVSWLYFASRLIELPLGVVSVAMGTVLIPELTRAEHSGDQATLAHAQSRALELAVGLALPATLGLIALRAPIVRLLFEHGAFTAADGLATAQALIWLALGLPAQVLVKTLSPAFYAREDTMTPLLATVKGLLVAIAAAIVLGHLYGASGIAAALALGAWSQALSLLRQGAAGFGLSLDPAARRRLPRIAAAAAAMGGLLWFVASLTPLALQPRGLAQAVALALLIAGAVGAYGLLLSLLGVTGWRQTVNAIRQGGAGQVSRF